jgi:uridine kinase
MQASILSSIVGAVLNKSDKTPVIIAIDGPSGSGKSSFAADITKSHDCNLFHMDDFFLPPERKTEERLATPGGNVDWERVKDEVLEPILSGKPFAHKIYNCKTGKYTKSKIFTPKRLNIIEGVYSMHPELIKYYDYKIFLDVKREKQLERIKRRTPSEKVYREYRYKWIPLEDAYFEAYNGRANSDFSFDTSGVF